MGRLETNAKQQSHEPRSTDPIVSKYPQGVQKIAKK